MSSGKSNKLRTIHNKMYEFMWRMCHNSRASHPAVWGAVHNASKTVCGLKKKKKDFC